MTGAAIRARITGCALHDDAHEPDEHHDHEHAETGREGVGERLRHDAAQRGLERGDRFGIAAQRREVEARADR